MNTESFIDPTARPNDRVRLTTIEVQSPDCDDGAVILQSTHGPSVNGHRGFKESFSFPRDALVILRNRGEGPATVFCRVRMSAESGVFVGSTRRGSFHLREGEGKKLLLQGGEVLTIRSLDAIEPKSGTPIRHGHITAHE